MQVSTKLFNDQQIRQFGKLTADIQQKQEKIASGKAVLRASDDPVVAANLSAAKEQEELLGRFEENAYKATLRLDASDKTIITFFQWPQVFHIECWSSRSRNAFQRI